MLVNQISSEFNQNLGDISSANSEMLVILTAKWRGQLSVWEYTSSTLQQFGLYSVFHTQLRPGLEFWNFIRVYALVLCRFDHLQFHFCLP